MRFSGDGWALADNREARHCDGRPHGEANQEGLVAIRSLFGSEFDAAGGTSLVSASTTTLRPADASTLCCPPDTIGICSSVCRASTVEILADCGHRTAVVPRAFGEPTIGRDVFVEIV